MRHRSAGKENADCNSSLPRGANNSKSLFKKKRGEGFFAVEMNVECKSNEEKHDVIVD
jgi:hypothetical protein